MSYTSLNFLGNATSYLSVPYTNLSFGASDFTIEWWQYQTDSNPYPRVFQIGSYPSTQIGVSIEGDTFYFWSDGSYIYNTSLSNYKNKWVHFAIVRQSNNNTIYLNGNPLPNTPFEDSANYNFTQDLVISNETNRSNGAAFGGQMYNFMWLIGTAKYTGPFTPSVDIPENPNDYALIINGNFSGGTESGSITNNNVGSTPNIPGSSNNSNENQLFPFTIQPNQRFSSISFGSFWYGKTTNFPGFLYKKNVGVGTRRSTKFSPGGNTYCNKDRHFFNKYKPGSSGVGATSVAVRRAKNRHATICSTDSTNNCYPCYMSLGQYNRYLYNPNGYYQCGVPIRLEEPDDGYVQTIVSRNGFIYTSTDFGNIWVQRYAAEDSFFQNILTKANNNPVQSAISVYGNYYKAPEINAWNFGSNLFTLPPTEFPFITICGSYNLQYQTCIYYTAEDTVTTKYTTNGGQTWNVSNIQLDSIMHVSSDSTGQYQLAAGSLIVGIGIVSYSSDYGNNWTNLSMPMLPLYVEDATPTNTPICCCNSGDNSVWVVGDYLGYLQYSYDNGDTWNTSITNPNVSAQSITFGFIKSSYDGNVIVAVNAFLSSLGFIWLSTDKGQTFNAMNLYPYFPIGFFSCDISSSGKVITALAYDQDAENYYYYFSKDSGQTWNYKNLSYDPIFAGDNGLFNNATN